MPRIPERVLSLDISTKTGWSVGLASDSEYRLLNRGTVGKIDRPDLPYPKDYVGWARQCFDKIQEVIAAQAPDVLVIEETTKGSKNNFSQKILEFIHFLVAQKITDEKLVSRYLMTGEWRDAVGAKMSTSESKQNLKSRQIKAKTGLKLAKDENGKILGRVTKKHVNVRRANEIFGLSLKLKDNDVADAILLGYAYYAVSWKGHKRGLVSAD